MWILSSVESLFLFMQEELCFSLRSSVQGRRVATTGGRGEVQGPAEEGDRGGSDQRSAQES